MFGKKKVAVCPFQLLFDILEDDMREGLCCDIHFIYQGKKHSFGVYGDDGNSYQNVKYYLDQMEVDSLEELKALKLEKWSLEDFQENVSVKECDGCYPDSTPLLVPYLSR